MTPQRWDFFLDAKTFLDFGNPWNCFFTRKEAEWYRRDREKAGRRRAKKRARAINKQIKNLTKGFLTRAELCKKIGVKASAIERYKLDIISKEIDSYKKTYHLIDFTDMIKKFIDLIKGRICKKSHIIVNAKPPCDKMNL